MRIRGHRGQSDVHAALVRFARWLRSVESFPVRLPVYLSPLAYLRTVDDEIVTASFFAPYDPTEEPYVRIATGDYPELLVSHGRDDALAMFLHSMAHELIHYRQWIDRGDITERGVVVRARNIIERYALTTDHP